MGLPITKNLHGPIIGSHTFSLSADMVDSYIFTAPYDLILYEITEIHVTAEAGGTVGIMPKRCQGTEAPASGDALLSTAFNGVGTAATLQRGNLVQTNKVTHFSAGDRLAIDFTNDTPGELAGVTITYVFQIKR